MSTSSALICLSAATFLKVITGPKKLQEELIEKLSSATAVFWLWDKRPDEFLDIYAEKGSLINKELKKAIYDLIGGEKLFLCPCKVGFFEAISRVVSACGIETDEHGESQPKFSALQVKDDSKEGKFLDSRGLSLRMPGTSAYKVTNDVLPISSLTLEGSNLLIKLFPTAEELFSSPKSDAREEACVSKSKAALFATAKPSVREEVPKRMAATASC